MLRTLESKLVSFEELAGLSKRLHEVGKRIISTNGCFDILHLGHIQYLSAARRLGDVLVCGVNADASVRKLKGPDRPVCDERTRALQLAGLEAIDYVTIFGEDTPVEFLRRLRPHVHVKGGDYEGKEMPERLVVESSGGEIVLVPVVKGFSTTNLIEKMKES